MRDVHLDLVAGPRVKATHVEVGTLGGDVSEERPVLEVHLREGGQRHVGFIPR